MTASVFSNVILGCFDITLQVTQPFSLPPMPGPVFRSSLNKIMREIACGKPSADCAFCPHREDCHFFWLYQNSGEFAQIKLARFRTPPKPFVLEPPIHIRPHYYHIGEILTTKLVLVGKALDFCPQWITVFQKMEKHQFNGIDTPFFLKTVVGKNGVTGDDITFFSKESADITTGNPAFSLSDFLQHHTPAAPISRITVTFKTPTRIKGAGSLSRAISFKILIQTLLTRVTTLAYNYCQQPHYLNFRELVTLADAIQIVEEQENPAFHSKTTGANKHSYLGGYIGQITYQGDLTPFWPLLKFAEIIHLGKNCTFGLGKIHATL